MAEQVQNQQTEWTLRSDVLYTIIGIIVLLAAAFCGAAAYVSFLQNPPTETPQSSDNQTVATTSAQSQNSDFSIQQTLAGESYSYSQTDIQGIQIMLNKNNGSANYSIHPESQWDSLYYFQATETFNAQSSDTFYVLAKKESDGSFSEITTSQGIIDCDTLAKEMIPHQVLDKCSYLQGETWYTKSNTLRINP